MANGPLVALDLPRPKGDDIPPLAFDSEAEQPAILLYETDSEDAGPRLRNWRSLERFGGPGWVRSRAASPSQTDSEDELETFLAPGGQRDRLVAELLIASHNAKSNSAGAVPFDRSSPGREKRRFEKTAADWTGVRARLRMLSSKSMSAAEAGVLCLICLKLARAY